MDNRYRHEHTRADMHLRLQ